jgi:hypothetical protein
MVTTGLCQPQERTKEELARRSPTPQIEIKKTQIL